jgi:hypothetical protein
MLAGEIGKHQSDCPEQAVIFLQEPSMSIAERRNVAVGELDE